MDNHQHAPVLTWGYLVQAKSVDELRHSLVCTTVELEQTRLAVQEEVTKRDDHISHLKLLLAQAIAERDEAHRKIQALLLQTPQPPLIPTLSTISTLDDAFDSQTPDCDVSSPDLPLPQKGNLLQAVMKAGPLLHTLLLAGPLPQWRHPPPPLHSFQLPPLHAHNHNCGVLNNNKRPFSLCEDLDSPTPAKLHTLLFH